MLSDPLNQSPSLGSDRDRIDEARGIFLDWDGCLAIGKRLVPSMRRLISRRADRVVIISNNSTQLPQELSRILERNGLVVPPERIVLAGTEAVRRLSRNRSYSVQMYAAPRMKVYAASLGIVLHREHADTVLVMRDPRFNYGKLLRAVNALHRGARLVAANADRTHPASNGGLVPETGALLAAIQTCVPHVKAEIVGKPSPLLFMMACEMLGIAPAEAVMIGDNPETDGRGAITSGIHPILIGGTSQRNLDDLVPA